MKLQTLVIVVGEMGMGKTHTAELIANKTGKHFYEGDHALPPGMKLNSKEAVEDFVKNYLIPAIIREMATHDDVVVAQALYFQDHRELILETFKDIADIKFINVTSTEDWQVSNLKKRPETDIDWLGYAKISKPYFQNPPENNPFYATINNNNNEMDVLSQINTIFQDFRCDKLVPMHRFFTPLLTEREVKTPVDSYFKLTC